MNAELRGTLMKVLLPLVMIAVPLVVLKVRGLDVREIIGLRKPPARLFAIFIAAWIAWMAVTELMLPCFGMDDPHPWKPYPMLILVLRILAIGLLGPIAEELVFRGVLYGRLVPYIGVAATIIGVAVVWGVIHVNYTWKTIVLICLDGMILGYARYKSRSVITPMVMHVLGNLFSIYQSLR